jgi:hypothetical protein
MKLLSGSLLAGVGALALATAARAELPPWVYGQEQRQAPYALELLVRNVRREADRLRVQAQVVQVKRQPQKARLQRGDQITVAYPVAPLRPAGWVGPAPIPTLRPGEQRPAWLSRDPSSRGLFQPAAGGRSFGPSLEAVHDPGL